MPRGKKELAEQITPELREVEVEVGRGKTASPKSATCSRGTRLPAGSAQAAQENPRDRGRTGSSSSRRLSFSTGSPISCHRRASTGIAITGCLRRITHTSQHQHPCRPSSALVSTYIGIRAEPVHSLLYLL